MPEPHSPLFIFSPRHQEELTELCREAGWRAMVAMDAATSGESFSASGAWVAVVDARGAMGAARKAVGMIAEAAERQRSALLLILGEHDADQLPWFRRNGVTHFLLEPISLRHFTEAVHYSARYAEHLSGGRRRGLRGTRSPAMLLLTESKRKRRRKRLEIDLPQALERGEIQTLFQPQVSIATGKIVGAEALARWRHPTFGQVGAEALFETAEGAGLLLPLSACIHATAFRDMAAWPEVLSDIRVAVNLTSEDLTNPAFARSFLALVDAAGLARDRITVEVTESGLVKNLNAAAMLLTELRSAGVRVAIDDFGTGYSSLAYLQALPLDYLKIDKKMSLDILGSSRDQVVVRGVIDMAKSLGLDVVAEGVESDDQLELLAAEGCTLSQGYLHSPPITSQAFARLAMASSASP
jgi:EAL domain-containing protein (putative c-di-GMP-specific phosphodiesterase class I)